MSGFYTPKVGRRLRRLKAAKGLTYIGRLMSEAPKPLSRVILRHATVAMSANERLKLIIEYSALFHRGEAQVKRQASVNEKPKEANAHNKTVIS